ncbi:MAG: zinc dependent phospholipase C family protein [Oscillospiraceae bacterium]|nr:zinc dependent phospholipase C family protein [Oscillospiraceae bacterium]
MHAQKCFDKISPKIALDRGFVGAAGISHDTFGLMPVGGYFACFNAAHDEKTDDYFLTLIAYIKSEKLSAHANAMGFLYGQIMHYALDTLTHPLIYYMTQCHPAKFFVPALGAHTMFEAWYDVQQENAEKARNSAFERNFAYTVKVSDGGINSLIDTVYDRVYGLKNAAAGYEKGIKVWELYGKYLRSWMLSHVKKYHSDFQSMLNEQEENFLHPVTNETLNFSFSSAYSTSIDLACELIAAADDNIYNGADNEKVLAAAFSNSYDTGVDWRIPEKKRFFKGYEG